MKFLAGRVSSQEKIDFNISQKESDRKQQ